MQKELRSFRDWGYPFIVQDYEGYFGCSCPDNMLGGIVLFGNDNADEVVEAVKDFINNNVSAIMIELEHIWNNKLKKEITTRLAKLFDEAGYIDLKSYEHRMAFGKR